MKKTDYTEYSREKIIEKIEELESLIQELMKEREQETRLEYAWTGNLGHWYWNIKTNQVNFNPLKVTTLGYDESEIPRHVTYQYFTEKLHPDDYKKTMEAMMDHLYRKTEVYETEYRIRTKDGRYKWYYDRGKITKYDDEGNPSFLAGIVFDITEKKETEKELKQKNILLVELSRTDGLTKLYNQRAIVENLQDAIEQSLSTNSALSIAIFDIDNFKNVNDTKGHVCGDGVISNIAQLIKNNIRDTDLAGRYGGEEFLVIFTGTNYSVASSIAERIRKAVESHVFAEEITVTISGGIKQYEGESMVEFIHKADEKLYEAKHKGKNQII